MRYEDSPGQAGCLLVAKQPHCRCSFGRRPCRWQASDQLATRRDPRAPNRHTESCACDPDRADLGLDARRCKGWLSAQSRPGDNQENICIPIKPALDADLISILKIEICPQRKTNVAERGKSHSACRIRDRPWVGPGERRRNQSLNFQQDPPTLSEPPLDLR